MVPQKMQMQGRAVERGEVWNKEKEEDQTQPLALRDIFCPECQTPHKTLAMRLKVKEASSSMVCPVLMKWFGEQLDLRRARLGLQGREGVAPRCAVRQRVLLALPLSCVDRQF